jgi:tetratricopeptide (TPR) repeat protein
MDSGEVQLDQGSDAPATQEWEKLKEDGRKFYQNCQWSKAIKCYTKAIALNPTAAVLYSNRALCQLRLSNFARAKEDAENAIAYDQKVVKYYRTLARALAGLKLHREAADACRAGLHLDPCDEVLLSMLLEVQALNEVDERQRKENPGNGGDASQDGIGCCSKDGSSDCNKRNEKTVFQCTISALRSALSEQLKIHANRGSVTARRYFNSVLRCPFGAWIKGFSSCSCGSMSASFLP